VGEKLLIFG
jgi:hypothetical protein